MGTLKVSAFLKSFGKINVSNCWKGGLKEASFQSGLYRTMVQAPGRRMSMQIDHKKERIIAGR